jgi:predicted nucleic acid-binding protein
MSHAHYIFDALLGVVDEVLPIDRNLIEGAKGIVLARRQLPARDALHYAVMQAHGIERILSFDTGFDGLPDLERLHA